MTAVKEQIEKEIPDADFNGIAVIDVEEFRPLYSMNWGAKEVSINHHFKDLLQ